LNLAAASAELEKTTPLMIKRQNTSQARYTRALRTLEQIRRAEQRPQRLLIEAAPTKAASRSIFGGGGIASIFKEIGSCVD
jgi:hypothetical protein